MNNKSYARLVGGLTILAVGGVTSHAAAENLATPAGPDHPTPIYGGQPATPCSWPSAVYLQGCTATLVSPGLVLTAAHCIEGAPPSEIALGDSYANPERRVGVTGCQAHPDYPALGRDIAFCQLAEDVQDVPLTPVVMGCQAELLEPQREVAIVGYGLADDDGGDGPKRVGWTQINEVLGDEVSIGGNGTAGACFGDSGGPAYVRLADGVWRVFGITSYSNSPDCHAPTMYTLMHTNMEWVESASGLDLTPCHGADGSWSPTSDCSEGPMHSDQGFGTWNAGCAGGPSAPIEAACEDPDDSDTDGSPDTGTDTEGETDDGATTGDSDDSSAGTGSDGEVPMPSGTSGGESTGPAMESSAGASDQDSSSGGGCTSGGNPPPWWLLLPILSVLLRRRRAHRTSSPTRHEGRQTMLTTKFQTPYTRTAVAACALAALLTGACEETSSPADDPDGSSSSTTATSESDDGGDTSDQPSSSSSSSSSSGGDDDPSATSGGNQETDGNDSASGTTSDGNVDECLVVADFSALLADFGTNTDPAASYLDEGQRVIAVALGLQEESEEHGDWIIIRLVEGQGVFAEGYQPGVFDVAVDEPDPEACGACPIVYGDGVQQETMLDPMQTLRATGGTLTIEEFDSQNGGRVRGHLDNATFVEVDANGDLVDDGCTTDVATFAFDSEIVEL